MTSGEQTTATIGAAGSAAGARSQARLLARRAMWRLAPAYARHRARRATAAESLQRIEDELQRVRKRHSEQIARLEDMAQELVLAVESLRREIERRDRGQVR
jgi:hypothetical protein